MRWQGKPVFFQKRYLQQLPALPQTLIFQQRELVQFLPNVSFFPFLNQDLAFKIEHEVMEKTLRFDNLFAFDWQFSDSLLL